MQHGVFSQVQVHGVHLYQHLQQEAATISIWEQQLQVAIALKNGGEMESLGLSTAQTRFL